MNTIYITLTTLILIILPGFVGGEREDSFLYSSSYFYL